MFQVINKVEVLQGYDAKIKIMYRYIDIIVFDSMRTPPYLGDENNGQTCDDRNTPSKREFRTQIVLDQHRVPVHDLHLAEPLGAVIGIVVRCVLPPALTRGRTV